jgi:hypothetical protein
MQLSSLLLLAEHTTSEIRDDFRWLLEHLLARGGGGTATTARLLLRPALPRRLQLVMQHGLVAFLLWVGHAAAAHAVLAGISQLL